MGSILFLPGILGSELFLDEEKIWPPTILEAKFGYNRVEKLLDENVICGKPIDSVLCFQVYESIIRDLEGISSGNFGAPKRSFHSIGYDWRINLFDTADNIANKIDDFDESQKDEIIFVCHSMGCLVARLIIESGKYKDRPWFSSIRTLVALAGPHLGSPTALIRVMGIEGSVGISASDVKKIAADRRYPALYQLLPAPNFASVWNTEAGLIEKVDLYSNDTVKILGLSPDNMKVAEDFHNTLQTGRKPDEVKYIYLAGSLNDTWSRVDVRFGRSYPRKGISTGDGVVPLWSAINSSYSHHAEPAPHDSLFRVEGIRNLIFHSIGARMPGMAFLGKTKKPTVSLLSSRPVFKVNKSVSISIFSVDPIKELSGNMVFEYTSDDDGNDFREILSIPVNYNGSIVSHFNFSIDSLTRVGIYRVKFDGSHETAENGAAVFVVSEDGVEA